MIAPCLNAFFFVSVEFLRIESSGLMEIWIVSFFLRETRETPLVPFPKNQKQPHTEILQNPPLPTRTPRTRREVGGGVFFFRDKYMQMVTFSGFTFAPLFCVKL